MHDLGDNLKDKISDKFLDQAVPTVSLFLAVVLACFAYFLWSTTQTTGVEAASGKEPEAEVSKSLALKDPLNVEDLKERYNLLMAHDTEALSKLKEAGKRNGPVKILLVPGHDEKYPGAEYGDTDEADLTLSVANQLADFLRQEDGFEVFVTRDQQGHNNLFEEYLANNTDSIKKFVELYKNKFNELKEDGEVEEKIIVDHNAAPDEVAFRLYGINKFVNDEDYDLVIHIHFNDYPDRKWGVKGRYKGFSIYIPEKQLVNNQSSEIFANYIRDHLNDYFAESNAPFEKDVVIEEQQLIAVGSNNTVASPSILIEYGYIYEDPFNNLETRDLIHQELAYQTYLGIKDFLLELPAGNQGLSTFYKPDFDTNLSEGVDNKKEVIKLQGALTTLGFYPPEGSDFIGCPIDGTFGFCTKQALQDFQKENNLQPIGVLGPVSRERLNNLIRG